MNRTVSLIVIALLTVVILALQILGEYFYLYWIYWWFDILMHGLGGFIIGSLALWFLIFERSVSSPLLLFYSIAITLGVGVLWEIFEYVTGISLIQAQQSYAVDTMGDIGMDIVGGLTAYLECSRLWRNLSP